MRMVVLQSGSNGNCVYVEGGGVRLLVDAGISGRQAELRLASHGMDIRQVDVLLISHDHRDHIRTLGVFQRKFGIPAYITEKTLAVAEQFYCLGRLGTLYFFEPGDILQVGGLKIYTIPTPHDAVEGVGFVFDDGQKRLGILTDLGHPFPELRRLIHSLDAVLLESNYDPQMLQQGPYPEWLKRRIQGPHGHLSNQEAAQLLRSALGGRLRWACLGHLSENNNSPEIALQTHQQLLEGRLPLAVASRYEVSDLFEV
ncbi:MAG: MBL fold metallo-hydrolase [Thermoguttaceae bacterium]|nr:MBL fold metallo-hydrolase [Thermoguttaceae bacterium]MDW8036493.1 MBL fold metallo-hydrolase [Thermoguttaceae bacterium]